MKPNKTEIITNTEIKINIKKTVEIKTKYKFLTTLILYICDWMEINDIKLIYSVLRPEEKAEIKKIMWEINFDCEDKEKNRKLFLNIAMAIDLEILKTQKQNITKKNKYARWKKKKSSQRKTCSFAN